MSWEEIKLQISDQVKTLMTDRGITDDDVKQVIHQAESTGEKLYQPGANKYLAKARLGEATIYVEYSVGENNYTIHTAYAHRSKIGKE
jgi:hypothetical protein